MTQGEVSVKIEEGGEGEAVSNGDDSSPTEETNAYDKWPQAGIKEPTNNDVPVSYTHLTLPTNREV